MKTSIEEKRYKILIDLINKMFEIAGHDVTYKDIKGRKDDWYTQWTMTSKQQQEWKEWGVKEIQKVMKYSEVTSRKEMNWINVMYGLKTVD